MSEWELTVLYVRKNAQGVITAIRDAPPIDDSGAEETHLKTANKEARIDMLNEKHKAQDQRRSELRRKSHEVEQAIKDYAAKKRKEVSK